MSAPRIATLVARIEARGTDRTWITRLPCEHVLALAEEAAALPDPAPLRGLAFAIKDNIDLAGVPTTAACPDFAYTPARSATVVDRLIAGGAVPLGKTNLDQFATGLVGVRSPYGVPVNPFNPAFIPGGSSSGSAVAVAAGLCDFALGTDTAGSGRVPAAVNNLVGLKPTRGLLSTRGVVPACRTLDCVSIFTRTVAEAARVFDVATGYDAEDPFSRRWPAETSGCAGPPRVGVPRADQLEFFGDCESAELFQAAISRWRALGATLVEVDYAPFREAARLLYDGPWVAERYAGIRAFIERRPEALHPVTRSIIEGAPRISAVEAFEAMYRLASCRRRAEAAWSAIDVLLTPTIGTVHTVAEVQADPLQLNSNLGYYTNHMNLLDLCALAVPAGFLSNGMPWGVTLSAPAFGDERLLQLGAQFLGEPAPGRVLARETPTTRVAVCGAHLSGLPLNPQLVRLGARLVGPARTAPCYRLFALPDATPPKPGLVRAKHGGGGASIEVEVWELPLAAYGPFVASIAAPLGIGTILLEDGSSVQGFLCESDALPGAREITRWGGWRAYLRSGATPQ